jgi:hypothetical protein
MGNWKVRTVSGSSGGVSDVAEVNLCIVAPGYTVDGVARAAEAAPDLLAACEEMLAYIEMKLAHNGSMDVETIQRRLDDVQRTIPYVETAHHLGCAVTTRHVDLKKARAAIASAK